MDWRRVAVCAVPILLVEEVLKAVGRALERRADRKLVEEMHAHESGV